MSNSARARTRRTKRSHATKHERAIMDSQHFGNFCGIVRKMTGISGPIPKGLVSRPQDNKDLKEILEGK